MPNAWDQVREILATALEMPAEERTGFVRQACGSDQTLFAEVESLLSHHDQADSLLENSPAAHWLTFDPAALAGKRIGAYKIIRQLGEGGMAVVYLGERDDQQFQKRVAIKMLRPGFYTAEIVHRFRNERQTLAALDHPNIVKLLDGGSTDSGLPYLVMDYVEGAPIDQFCRVNLLSIRSRLQLFLTVSAAVQYAHKNLVIHRDLKPGNILITKDGVPRLLDFGIAKLLNPEFLETPLITRTESRPMTLEYASPEQVRGEPVTESSDIYSMGVLLYELLAGRRPYLTDGLSRLEIERMSCEQEPARPSVSTATEPRRALEGDLDTIVLKALRKEPAQRYASVEQFTEDIQHHLDGLPVRARKPTGAYRGARFLHRHKESLSAVLAVLVLVAAIAGVGYFFFQRPKPLLTDKDTIVLADFTNTTGDALFNDALKQAAAVELGQSPFLNVLSDRRVSEVLRMMGRPAGERVNEEVGRELCRRSGSKAILSGSISTLGPQYVIGLVAVACATGDVLDREQAVASGKSDVLKALHKAASALRAKLGESLPSVQKFEVPIEATTTSLEALQNYGMSIKITRQQGDAPGIPFLKRAIELDPNFPLAYAGLSLRYGNLSQPSLALEYAAKAYDLRDRATEREKLRISAAYFRATGETEKEVEAYQLWIANYPRDHAPHGNVGIDYGFMGQYDLAVAHSQEALRLEPNEILDYVNLGALYLNLDRLDDAQAVFDRALARKLDGGSLRWMLYYLAFLRGDPAQMEQQVAWAAGKPGDEDALLSFQSDTEAYYGRLTQARTFSRKAVDSAVRSDSKEPAALWQANAALREAEFGLAARAKQGVANALALDPGRDVKVLAALALARIGETTQAKRLVQELEKSYPSNTMLKRYWLPAVNAALELKPGHSSEALVLLEAAAPYELGWPPPLQVGTLYPALLRGEAYLQTHNGSAAAAEFRKLINHRGIVANFPTGVLAQVGLARAYVLQGDTAKARSTYRDFLALWKDADPDIPLLKQAQAEYAKLQ